MKRPAHRSIYLLPMLLSLGACITRTSTYRSDNVNQGVVLARDSEAEVERTWRLFPGRDDDPRVQIESRTTEQLPKIGVTVTTLTPERAVKVGVEPFHGVLVRRVAAGQPAALAGLKVRDVITAVAGNEVSTAEQFDFYFEENAAIETDLELTVERPSGEDGFASSTVTVRPIAESVTSSRTESVALDQSRGLVEFAGLGAAVVPPSLAEPIYGTDTGVPVVTGVVTGSPAYRAGLRCGDRILAVDGQPANSLTPLRQAMLALMQRDQPRAFTFDLREDPGQPIEPALDDIESITLQVESPTLGPFVAEVPFEPDYLESSEFYVPILFNYESTTSHSESGFLNFIFTFGWDHESHYLPSASREPARRSKTTVLPLGLVQVDRRPGRTEWTLLWFISWETSH